MPFESKPNDSRRIETGEAPPTIALVGATDIAERIASSALRAGVNVIIDDISYTRRQAISIHLHDVLGPQHCYAPGLQDRSASPRSVFSSSAQIPSLTLTQSLEPAIRAADFLIDALPDDLEVKLELFTLFDKFAKPNTIFVTMGSIPIDDLAEITFCPERCIAVQLNSPANENETEFQLIPGKQTSLQTLATCTDLFLHSLAFRAT